MGQSLSGDPPGAAERWLASGMPRLWVQHLGEKPTAATVKAHFVAADREFGPLDKSACGEILNKLWSSRRKPGGRDENSLGTKSAWIPPGEFSMGSPGSEAGRMTEELLHPVVITRGFWLGVHQITQEEFKAVMGFDPSHFTGNFKPVECADWDKAQEDCTRLTRRDRDGRRYRLPTEAEWEYACRASTTTAYHFGDRAFEGYLPQVPNFDPFGLDALGRHAWYEGNARGTTQPCGNRAMNRWGLPDMHGNVWEWCADWYDVNDYRSSPRLDPRGPATGLWRVLRGGSWANQACRCRSAQRSWLRPDHPERYGFRVVMEPPDLWCRNDL